MTEQRFDPAWYAQAFPDVALTGLAPEAHYHKYGRILGRAPNAEAAGEEPKAARAVAAPVSLWAGGLEIGHFQVKEALPLGPLEAYRQMLRLPPDVFGQVLQAAPDLGPCPQAAWLKGNVLRIAAGGQHLRLYQAPPEAPAALALIGGAELVGAAGFAEAALLNPMMPVLIEHAAPEGLTTGYTLLPFPTLLRGGLHFAEAVAWGLGRDPMADLWRLSRAYLDEMLSGAPPKIGSLTAETLDPPLAEALGPVFGLTGEMALDLGPDAVPTIAALVSRRIDQAKAAPFLVVDKDTYRPLSSVALPSDAPLAPVHLSLRLSAPAPVEDILSFAAPPVGRLAETEVTVALRGSDPALAARALATAAMQVGAEVGQVLIFDPNTGENGLSELAEGIFPGRVQSVPAWDLDALEAAASGEALLLMDEEALLYDPATLAGLVQLLADHPQAGCVAPALLHEARFKKGTRVQLASAGLFPMGLSFAAAPRLTVAAMDVLRALPGQSYPVLANTHDVCLIRRAAVRATAEARRGAWQDVFQDLKLGLDLAKFGWDSLCSTAIRAGTTRAPLPRFDTDPIGLAYLSPADWAALLDRVTLVRELRG